MMEHREDWHAGYQAGLGKGLELVAIRYRAALIEAAEMAEVDAARLRSYKLDIAASALEDIAARCRAKAEPT